MTLQGGDREYGHADQVTFSYSDPNNDVTDASAGMAVGIVGDLDVTVSNTNNSVPADGVLSVDASDGDGDATVHLHGAVWARVDDADNVSAGDTVGAGTTAGVLTTGGSDYDVLVGETDIGGSKYALVYLD